MFAIACATPNTPQNVPKSLAKVRKQLEARVKKLQASRTDREDRRRKQLWSIAKALDDIAREEVKGMDSPSSLTEVKVTFTDDPPIDLSIDLSSSSSDSD